jgi:hypothetical protein
MICWTHGQNRYNVHIFDIVIYQQIYNERHHFYQTAYILHLFAPGEDKQVIKSGPTQVFYNPRGEREVRPSPWLGT